MLKTKLSLLGLFALIAAISGAITLTPTPASAEPRAPCPNTWCAPGDTDCDYTWSATCSLSGVPPHYCTGWSYCP